MRERSVTFRVSRELAYPTHNLTQNGLSPGTNTPSGHVVESL